MPHRPPPPLVSDAVWLEGFLSRARELLASPPAQTLISHPAPIPTHEHVEGESVAQPEVGSTRVLRTRPRSCRRRRRYEPMEQVDNREDVLNHDQPSGDVDFICIEGRFGPSYLTGRAADVWKDFSPTLFKFPDHIPLDEPVEIWGRPWIVKASSIGDDIGYGLYTLEDIVVPPKPWRRGYDGEHLFPYIGTIYNAKSWNILLRQHPSWGVYALRMDSDPD